MFSGEQGDTLATPEAECGRVMLHLSVRQKLCRLLVGGHAVLLEKGYN